MNEQGQDEIEFTSQILYYPQKIQKKKKQKKKVHCARIRNPPKTEKKTRKFKSDTEH